MLITNQVFLDLIKVPFHNNYFVILNTGLFLYNFEVLDCALLYSFNDSIIRNSDNRINVTDLIYDNYLYILSLVNEYLFVFNINNNRTFCYKINNIDFTGNYYYNIMGYKAKKYNISFIIVYHKEEAKLNFYYYNFSLRKGINEPKEIVIDDINIKNNLVRCTVINKISQIICYFYKEDINFNNHYLSVANYFIEDMNISPNQTYNFQTSDYINQIKFVLSSNNNFFICITVSSRKYTYCYINNGKSNNFKEGNCAMGSGTASNYGIFYFNSTDAFMCVSRYQKVTTLINNLNKEIKLCDKKRFNEGEFDFSIIYDNTINN